MTRQSAFPELSRPELEELCLRQNMRVLELEAALRDLCGDPGDGALFGEMPSAQAWLRARAAIANATRP